MDELAPSNMELLPTVDSPIEAHRRIFNKKVFSMNPDLTFDEEPKKTSKHLTPQQWSEICSVLRSWGPKGSDGKYLKVEAIEDETLKAGIKVYRQINVNKYKWAKNYLLETYTLPNGDIKD